MKPAELVKRWNAIAAEVGWTRVLKLTTKRATAARARLREHTIDEVDRALAAARALRWARGENDRNWKANIEWFLRPDTITKLLEGQYGEAPPPARPGGGPRRRTLEQLGHRMDRAGEVTNAWCTLCGERADMLISSQRPCRGTRR